MRFLFSVDGASTSSLYGSVKTLTAFLKLLIQDWSSKHFTFLVYECEFRVGIADSGRPYDLEKGFVLVRV